MAFGQATDLKSWQSLKEHHQQLGKTIVVKDEFAADPDRFKNLSRTFKNGADNSEILFDFSKNLMTAETVKHLSELAREAGVEQLRDRMFNGEQINFTEKRAVLHAALRNVDQKPMSANGTSVVGGVQAVLDHMREFSEQVRSGEWKGYSGKAMNTIVNIGIGGSDL